VKAQHQEAKHVSPLVTPPDDGKGLMQLNNTPLCKATYVYIYYIYIYISYIIYTHARDSNSGGEVNGVTIETWSDLMFKRTGLTGSLYKDSLQSLKRTHVPGSRLGDSQDLYTRILWGNLRHVRTKDLCNEFTKSVYKGPLKELKRSLCTRHHKTKGIHRISTQRSSETHRIPLRPDLGTHKIFAQGFIRGTHRISLQGSLKANFIGSIIIPTSPSVNQT
jgi:hypothetical protein